MDIVFRAIGVIHTPFSAVEGTPIQPRFAAGIRGRVEVFPEFVAGLQDLDGFSHIILLYHFHRISGYQLSVNPFLDEHPRGLFATRAPVRPNPIGLSVVELLSIERDSLFVEGVDMLDGTPLLDVKPFVPQVDCPEECRTGWLEEALRKGRNTRADDRFK
jgi:tRNA-Thr(GGU) m(6)t(6)A37 methyltransferase TsaA